MSQYDDPRCPACNRPGVKSGKRLFFCPTCRMEYEPDDDGTTGYGDPARIAAEHEHQRLAEKARKRRRWR